VQVTLAVLINGLDPAAWPTDLFAPAPPTRRVEKKELIGNFKNGGTDYRPTSPVDFRRGMDSLAMLVTETLRCDP
jgi:hypothetical protein